MRTDEICPGHVHLNGLAECVQRGIAEAGGTGIRMNIGVCICDGIAMGHEGMKYSLPSREINRDCIIDMVKAYGIFDGIVYIAACDKIIEESCPPLGSCTGLFTVFQFKMQNKSLSMYLKRILFNYQNKPIMKHLSVCLILSMNY